MLLLLLLLLMLRSSAESFFSICWPLLSSVCVCVLVDVVLAPLFSCVFTLDPFLLPLFPFWRTKRRSSFMHISFDLIRFLFVFFLQLPVWRHHMPHPLSPFPPVRSFISLICSHLSDARDGKFIIMQICKLHSNSNLIRFASNRVHYFSFSWVSSCACPPPPLLAPQLLRLSKDAGCYYYYYFFFENTELNWRNCGRGPKSDWLTLGTTTIESFGLVPFH